VQLVVEQPLQDEPADDDTVSPPPPLLTKPQADMSFFTFLLVHPEHSGVSLPMIRHSKFSPHFSQ
jgi:hypothetical protein